MPAIFQLAGKRGRWIEVAGTRTPKNAIFIKSPKMFCLALARRVCDAWLSNKGVTRRAWRPFSGHFLNQLLIHAAHRFCW
jgi:hypothetical protein